MSDNDAPRRDLGRDVRQAGGDVFITWGRLAPGEIIVRNPKIPWPNKLAVKLPE